MLGVDAVDSMLFGGNDEGREATFNSPDYVNGKNRPYDRYFDPAALARAAGRQHTFSAKPRRLKELSQWDWVVPHCDEKDAWLDRIRAVMTSLSTNTKWLIHGYESCGVAEVKRPMLEMLREGLNHHDRIPHPQHSLPLASWVRHIIAHYKKLPEYVFFAPASVPASSSVFSAASLSQSAKASNGFGVWGSHVVEMPQSLMADFCAKMWPHTPKAHRKGCPERVVTMADAVTMVAKRHILHVPLESWRSLEKLLADKSPANEQLLAYGWHLLFGQSAVLAQRSMSRH